ncbi:hypothetical protein scyTo_0024787, partial [Scyliorhinus torazame]|nr:hypothetical protein [Scyliorhinus torazame]
IKSIKPRKQLKPLYWSATRLGACNSSVTNILRTINCEMQRVSGCVYSLLVCILLLGCCRSVSEYNVMGKRLSAFAITPFIA